MNASRRRLVSGADATQENVTVLLVCAVTRSYLQQQALSGGRYAELAAAQDDRAGQTKYSRI